MSLRCRVYLAWEGGDRESVSITKPEQAYELVKDELSSSDRERFLSVLLSTKNTVIGIETVGIGTINTCTVTARELFKGALLANAHQLILCHNHPSGDPTPSDEDIAITRRITEAGDIIGITVLDHLVIGRDMYRSLEQMGVLRPEGRSMLSGLKKNRP